MDEENESKFKGLFPTRQNAIVCPKCREDSLVTEGIVSGLDVSFRRECGHVDKLQPPIFMLTNRVLPDLNIMISKTLSRLIRLGYFNGFEVVVPEFLLDVVDGFKGAGSKKALSTELDELRTLEGEGKIKLLSLQQDPISENDEDKRILGLSELTNAILITGDDVLKNRAVMRHRPTIFIRAEVFAQIKMLDEVRVP